MISKVLESLLHLGVRLQSTGEGDFWMPVRASSTAEDVDRVFDFIYWISIFFFALIVVLMVLFVVRYRRREGRRAEDSPSHNMWLETTWTAIPLILVIVIFWLGFRGFLRMRVAPENAYEIQVTGYKWNWEFTYPNGYVDAALHVPVDTPVLLTMSSRDVIHSFYIPAFRVKRDVVPGRFSKVWFNATKAGEFNIFCAEYCGTSHSDMLARVVVHEPGGFESWLEDASNFLDRVTPAEGGQMLYQQRGCATCHSVDGRALVGPTFLGLFGREELMKDGDTVVADENYIRESIVAPQARVVNGYDPVMPTYQGRLSDREISAIIAYIKTLDGATQEQTP